MMTRFAAAALFALALPLVAQDADANPAEATFYKAYWLENGERNFAAAMVLYDQFLEQAPEHRLAREAARFQFGLLTRTGKADAAAVFAKKHQKLLGDVATGSPARPGADAEPGGRGAGRPRDGGAGRGADVDPAQRLADLEKQLAEAKQEGDDDRVTRLERQIARMRRAAEGGGEGGRGPGGERRGFAPVEFAKMSKEELDEFKTQRLERMTGMIDRLRENGMDERADQLQASVDGLKKALDAGNLEQAQAAWDKMTEGMRRGRGGRGGGGGGDNGGGGGDTGGDTGGGRRRGGGGGGGGGGD
ncbi:MAG: hypothetical protein AB7O97_13120 [Planctomycetota bacterium]